MVRSRKTRNLGRKAPLWIAIAAGISAVALAALVMLFAARTVQADAALPRIAIAAPASLPATSATPASLARQDSAPAEPSVPQASPTGAASQWTDRIHGVASWYGSAFNGHRTASGEIYDMNDLTACHPSLPFGSVVRVVNRRNHRSVVVRITDRGDLVHEGRVIDLSYAAAEKLGIIWSGLARVDLEVLSLGRPHGQR